MDPISRASAVGHNVNPWFDDILPNYVCVCVYKVGL